MLIPLSMFWVLIFIGKNELGFKGVVFCILLWLGLLIGYTMLSLSWY
jgi:hypothetical protein